MNHMTDWRRMLDYAEGRTKEAADWALKARDAIHTALQGSAKGIGRNPPSEV